MDIVDAADLQSVLQSVLEQPASSAQLPELERLGRALYEGGRLEAALTAFEALVDRGMADTAPCWLTITGLRHQLQLPHLALDAARRAVALAPESADAWCNLGVLLGETGDNAQALTAYERALSIDASHYGSMRNLPLLLARIGRQSDARAADQSLLRTYPDDPWLHFNSGDLLLGMRAAKAAETAFRRALSLAPEFHSARYALSIALAAQGMVQEAQAERDLVLAAEPGLLWSYKSPLAVDEGAIGGDVSPERVAVIAAFEELRVGDWRRYSQIVDLYAGLVRGSMGAAPLSQHEMPYCSLSLPLEEDARQSVARQAAKRIVESVNKQQIVRPRRRKDGRLHIGYISANFRPHPNARLMGRLYARHDRGRFKVHAYSLGPIQDSPERSRVIANVDVFRDVGRLPAAAAAQLMINDGVDILVDLSGYARHARPEILALRPAPIQLSYVGYMGTMGAEFIDYALLDREILRPEARAYWDEKIVYLPHCSYHCELPAGLPPTPSRTELGLPASGPIFGALHHPRKLEPMTWAIWMALLKEIPEATLWLLCEADEQRGQLLSNAAAHGISADRLVFSGPVEQNAHLARLRCADLFLDTFVYNGHTTTVDALGVGVPVVTLSGKSVVARIAGSMLKAHGLPELVADNEQAYKSIVHRFVGDSDWRRAIGSRARDQAASKLFRPEERAREIEAAYELMWGRYQAGLHPADFEIPEAQPA